MEESVVLGSGLWGGGMVWQRERGAQMLVRTLEGCVYSSAKHPYPCIPK